MKKIYAIFAVFIFLGMTQTTLAARPVVNLHPASNITQTTATLSLAYTSDSTVSSVTFQYTNDPSFGSGKQTVYATGNSVNLTGLTPSTTYYFRASVSNNDGSTVDPVSGSYNFTTTGYSSAYVETLNEENVTVSSMTLTGRVNTYGASGSAYYNFYSSNCSSLISTTSSTSLSAITGSQYVKTAVSGLSANTTYCAELVAVVNGTTYYGGKVSVQTTNSYTPTYTCSITSFYADSTSVTSGNSTTLHWATSNCTSTSLTNYGSVSLNSSQSTGALYTTTSYTLNAYGGVNGNDSKTISIGVLPNNGGTPTTYPSCYYAGTCYWNGSYWVTINNGCTYNCGGTPTTYPSCYYTGTCYWNGSYWVTVNNGCTYNCNNNNGCTYNCNTNQYPSCYYDSTCYQSNGNWYYKTSGTIVPYTYNPHTPVNNTTKYITNKLPNVVKTIYQDQPVVTNPVQYVQTSPYDNTSPVMYNSYNANDIMNRYGNAFYDYTRDNNANNVKGNLLTGSAGSVAGINLIELLLALIVIALIVYLVKSNQSKDTH